MARDFNGVDVIKAVLEAHLAAIDDGMLMHSRVSRREIEQAAGHLDDLNDALRESLADMQVWGRRLTDDDVRRVPRVMRDDAICRTDECPLCHHELASPQHVTGCPVGRLGWKHG